jgi:hypothetical protein
LNGVSNCDLSLNREKTLSVIGLKTSFNNSDAALIAPEHAKQNLSVSAVYVLNMRGQPLMPTTPRKVKKLSKEGKAKVVKRTPFTIQLKYATCETKQAITLGIDSGFENIGISAITEKKEVYSAIKLIEKVKQLLPITKIVIEVAAFDIQKIKNPEISGTEYQNGVQKDRWNTRE